MIAGFTFPSLYFNKPTHSTESYQHTSQEYHIMDKLKNMLKKDDKPGSSSSGGDDAVTADKVVLHTNVGDITVQLYPDQTPKVLCPGITPSI